MELKRTKWKVGFSPNRTGLGPTLGWWLGISFIAKTKASRKISPKINQPTKSGLF